MSPPMPDTPPPPPLKSKPARTIERVLVETFMVALAGAFVLGVAWEMGKVDVGWVIAIIIWIAGAPFLELVRMLSIRR